MKVDYKEIFKLKIMLDNENIPYDFFDRSFVNPLTYSLEKAFFQIIVYEPNQVRNEEKRLISVIEGYTTYGADEDLLEIQGCLTEEELKCDSVLGYLTSNEVLNRIKNNYYR